MWRWGIALAVLGTLLGIGLVIVFLFILVVGFIYAWKKGALEWA